MCTYKYYSRPQRAINDFQQFLLTHCRPEAGIPTEVVTSFYQMGKLRVFVRARDNVTMSNAQLYLHKYHVRRELCISN